MPTNTAFITDSLRDIAVVADGSAADASELQDGLKALNRMMAAWTVADKEIGYFPQDTLADSIPIPVWAEEAVQACLAIKLAAVFRVAVRPELAIKAMEGESLITRTCINAKLEGLDMDHMATGAGYYSHNILTDTS